MMTVHKPVVRTRNNGRRTLVKEPRTLISVETSDAESFVEQVSDLLRQFPNNSLYIRLPNGAHITGFKLVRDSDSLDIHLLEDTWI